MLFISVVIIIAAVYFAVPKHHVEEQTQKKTKAEKRQENLDWLHREYFDSTRETPEARAKREDGARFWNGE